ncbi:MAG: indolepyruvate oxidoreductase subunit beta [Candidatus Thermoplasmatota archaeon]|nr:indolepyruvate oxidoreductase subunit beta [Candidatus Thermoplasmatota archaeon]MDP7265098.1 indolepyruvate oxidoreductase subunit beta [Candidatus Thermoplasmatota archaeon]
MKINIYLAGIGGQGILTAAQVLGRVAVDNGVNVLVNETHGMAQRGGVVTCNVRYGDVFSPLIPEGEADVLTAFEPVEALRSIKIANENTYFIVNTARIYPFTVSLGQEKYPPMEYLMEKIKKISRRVVFLDASELAREAGNEICTNMVLVGGIFALGVLPFDKDQFITTLERVLPPKIFKVNLEAFLNGNKFVRDEMAPKE